MEREADLLQETKANGPAQPPADVHDKPGNGSAPFEYELLQALQEALHEAFAIDHVTIQIEPPDFRDGTACEHQ